jgi:hypothetical protein
MTSLHRLIAIGLIWIVSGGVLTVFYESQFLNRSPVWAVLLVTLVCVGGAAVGSWAITRKA